MRSRETPPAGERPDPGASPRPVEDREAARFLRPQPPIPIPERARPQPAAGLLAHTLLGNRVYTKGAR